MAPGGVIGKVAYRLGSPLDRMRTWLYHAPSPPAVMSALSRESRSRMSPFRPRPGPREARLPPRRRASLRRMAPRPDPYRRPMPTLIDTSHPGLASALRRRPLWVQVSTALYGSCKSRSAASTSKTAGEINARYGGHFLPVQGFRYVEGMRSVSDNWTTRAEAPATDLWNLTQR